MSDEQLSVSLSKPLKQLSENLPTVLAVLQGVCQSLVDLAEQVESLQTKHQEMEDRMAYAEYGLHADNERLRDENLGWRQRVDYDSEDYCSNEDSFERNY